MGPRSENRGYGRCTSEQDAKVTISGAHLELQWVHGPRTVVTLFSLLQRNIVHISFNGSTVREPWLRVRYLGQWN